MERRVQKTEGGDKGPKDGSQAWQEGLEGHQALGSHHPGQGWIVEHELGEGEENGPGWVKRGPWGALAGSTIWRW